MALALCFECLGLAPTPVGETCLTGCWCPPMAGDGGRVQTNHDCLAGWWKLGCLLMKLQLVCQCMLWDHCVCHADAVREMRWCTMCVLKNPVWECVPKRRWTADWTKRCPGCWCWRCKPMNDCVLSWLGMLQAVRWQKCVDRWTALGS